MVEVRARVRYQHLRRCYIFIGSHQVILLVRVVVVLIKHFWWFEINIFPKLSARIIKRNYILLFNFMKQTRDKNIDKPLKLPQITSKTSTSFSTETSNSRIRPSSSSKLNELEKNLFSQLNDYEDLSKREIKKSKTRKDIEPDASK